MMVKYMDMSGLGVNGFIGFSVKAKDNDENRAVHEWFTGLAEASFSGDYTATLRFLKDSVEVNAKEEALFVQMNELHSRLGKLDAQLKELKSVPSKQEDDDEVF